jgi:hypothetical protein
MPIQNHFNTFNKNIYLTNQSAGYKKAKQKDESIFQEIKEAFKEAGFPIIESFMQGSFAVDTAINSIEGDFDIDRAIVIDSDTASKDPLVPKKLILDTLFKRSFKDPRVKKPCVTADYTSTNLHIDYIVYQKKNMVFEANYELAVGKLNSGNEHKEWSPSDPKGLTEWINDIDSYGVSKLEKRKQFKRLVRYVKRWRDVNFSEEVRKKVFSIGLTVMFKEQFKPSYYEPEISDDLIVLKAVIDNILNGSYFNKQFFSDDYRVSVSLPKVPYRDIFQHKVAGGGSEDGSDLNVGNQLRIKLNTLQGKLQNAINESDEIEQCKILNKVFGNDFKVPSESRDGKVASTGIGAAILPTAGASGTSQGA